MVTACGDDDAGPNLERLFQHVRYIFDRTEKEDRRVVELCLPGKFGLSACKVAGPVFVVFQLGFKLHPPHAGDESRSWFVGGLPEILAYAIAFDKAHLRIEVRADVFINGDETHKVVFIPGIEAPRKEAR